MVREIGKAYSHACLAVTPKLHSLGSCFKALAGRDRTIQEEINCFRSMVERMATLKIVSQRLKHPIDVSCPASHSDLLEVREILSRSIGTRFNWTDLQSKDFSEMPDDTSYVHNPEESWTDLSASNILGVIDKLQKTAQFKGIRPFYNFCCEFVHPNIGDNFSATAGKRLIQTDGGQLAYETVFHEDPFRASAVAGREFFERQILFINAYKFALRLVQEVVNIVAEFSALLDSIKILNRKFAHMAVRKQVRCFSKSDYCPCGSGKSIGACVFGTNSLRR